MRRAAARMPARRALPIRLVDLSCKTAVSRHEREYGRLRMESARQRVMPGDIAAVIGAHDRALHLLPIGNQIAGLLAIMLVMVGSTCLLFGG